MTEIDHALLRRVQDILSQAMIVARTAVPDQAERKAHQDFVTNVDLEVDRFLDTALSALIPDCPVLSEERAVDQAAPLQRYWIVDPIDGTLNLMADLPFYGIAIALVTAEGPQLAAVGAVAQNRIYSALRGGGAWLDDTPLRLPASPPDLIVLSTGLMDQLHADADGTTWQSLRAIGKIRNLGAQSLHLCHVAQGSFAGVASIEACIWDEAAGGLILREAGGLWQSQADHADWQDPAALMAVRSQRSLAAHPQAADAMASSLERYLV